ncbi:MAG: 3'-5' exonuclease [Burkholderiaceae bacterium]|nr:3'-5' exonuclease [Burkholderiaceae bacterium]
MSGFGALRRWLGGEAPAAPTRWVVIDVESSGLDIERDHLLAIGAVALQLQGDAPPHIALGDSFELVLRHEAVVADKPNILLHGIGVGAQRLGLDPVQALQAFEQWLGDAPLLAFHSAFDEGMIGRAMRQHLGRKPGNPWVDLAAVAPVLLPRVRAHSLDDWMAHFGIVCAARHQAVADALATAELLLKLWPALRVQSRDCSFRALQAVAAQRRWLQPS